MVRIQTGEVVTHILQRLLLEDGEQEPRHGILGSRHIGDDRTSFPFLMPEDVVLVSGRWIQSQPTARKGKVWGKARRGQPQYVLLAAGSAETCPTIQQQGSLGFGQNYPL